MPRCTGAARQRVRLASLTDASGRLQASQREGEAKGARVNAGEGGYARLRPVLNAPTGSQVVQPACQVLATDHVPPTSRRFLQDRAIATAGPANNQTHLNGGIKAALHNSFGR